MKRNHRTQLAAATLGALAGPFLLISTASAAPSEWQDYTFPYGPQANEDFCGVTGLTAIQEGVVEGRRRALPHGPDGLIYEYAQERFTDTWTNAATGAYVTVIGSYRGGAHKVVDNGDGTSTVTVKNAGTTDYYNVSGERIAHEAGMASFSLLFDNAGTPSDPADDVPLAFLGFNKNVGRTGLFCPTIVNAIS